MVLLALFSLVLFLCAYEKFDSAANRNSVAGLKHGKRIAPYRPVGGILKGRLRIGEQGGGNDFSVPGYGYHIRIAALLQRRSLPNAHFQLEVASEPGRDLNDHLGRGGMLRAPAGRDQKH